MGALLDAYTTGGFFDEVLQDDGVIREHHRALIERLRGFTTSELERRERIRDALFRSAGITFAVYGDDAGVERTFPMDLLPRIIPAAEWAHVEAGVIQRVTALDRFLEDLDVGEQAAVHDGVVRRWLVRTADGFRREAFGIPVPHAARCLVSGVDLVRDEDGRYVVLEDNLRNPPGISYVLENRAAMTRVLPLAFAEQRVRPVYHYGPLLLQALQEVAPPAAGEYPRAVVLTPGVHNSADFEHVFLARQMGIELVEGRDLVVEDHVVHMRTTRDLKRVDVIYRRIDDDFLDPVVFRPDSALDVPGLLSAARAGNVTIANAVGNRVADDEAVYAFVPDLIRFSLGEEPVRPVADVPLAALADERFRDQHRGFLGPSSHAHWGGAVAAEAHAVTAGPVGGVVAASEAVHERVSRLEYRTGVTDVGIGVDEVFAAGSGVCQDFAHLAIAMLRELSIPGCGWLALDPTNAQAVSERHVTIGRGRDYDDVAPFRGVFVGEQHHELDVSVTMRRLALAPLGETRLRQGAQQQ